MPEARQRRRRQLRALRRHHRGGLHRAEAEEFVRRHELEVEPIGC